MTYHRDFERQDYRDWQMENTTSPGVALAIVFGLMVFLGVLAYALSDKSATTNTTVPPPRIEQRAPAPTTPPAPQPPSG